MHFPHASVFLISFGFQHYWFVLWRGGGRREVMFTGVVKSTLPPGFGLVYGGGGVGLE